MKKVCVLGRGKSLLSVETLPDDALYVTVNRYAEELSDLGKEAEMMDEHNKTLVEELWQSQLKKQ